MALYFLKNNIQLTLRLIYSAVFHLVRNLKCRKLFNLLVQYNRSKDTRRSGFDSTILYVERWFAEFSS